MKIVQFWRNSWNWYKNLEKILQIDAKIQKIVQIDAKIQKNDTNCQYSRPHSKFLEPGLDRKPKILKNSTNWYKNSEK